MVYCMTGGFRRRALQPTVQPAAGKLTASALISRVRLERRVDGTMPDVPWRAMIVPWRALT